MEGFGTKSTLKVEMEEDTDCKRRGFILSTENERAVDILNKTRLNDENHFETGLL